MPRCFGFIALTPKEEEIYILMLNGLKPQEIADRLVLARCTVATHIAHIFQKKGVYSTQELLAEKIRELEEQIKLLTAT